MLSIIVAKAKNNIIGKNNRLIWDIPDDKKRFKERTKNHIMIMGRKTFESMGEVLPDHTYIIFSQNPDFKIEKENVRIVHSMFEIQEFIESKEECFVIGGAMIYNLLMQYVNKMYVTEIDKDFEGDTFFQKINPEKWKEVSREEGPKTEGIHFDYDYVVYERISK